MAGPSSTTIAYTNGLDATGGQCKTTWHQAMTSAPQAHTSPAVGSLSLTLLHAGLGRVIHMAPRSILPSAKRLPDAAIRPEKISLRLKLEAAAHILP